MRSKSSKAGCKWLLTNEHILNYFVVTYINPHEINIDWNDFSSIIVWSIRCEYIILIVEREKNHNFVFVFKNSKIVFAIDILEIDEKIKYIYWAKPIILLKTPFAPFVYFQMKISEMRFYDAHIYKSISCHAVFVWDLDKLNIVHITQTPSILILS